jgi:membrane fusion protein (multidrug efflux system)
MPRSRGLLPVQNKLALMFLAASIAAAQAQAPGGPPPAVGFVEARRQPVTESTEFIGRIEAISRVDIRARVTGFLEQRLFTEGAEVPEDAPLFRIERAPFEAQLDQARANAASAEAQLANARTRWPGRGSCAPPGRHPGRAGQRPGAGAHQRRRAARRAGGRAHHRDQPGLHRHHGPAGRRDRPRLLRARQRGEPDPAGTARHHRQPGSDAGVLHHPAATGAGAAHPLRRARRRGSGGGARAQRRWQRVPLPGRVDFIDTSIGRDTDSLLVRATLANPVREGARPGAPGSRGLVDGQFVTVLLEGAEPVQAVTVPRAAVAQDQGGFFVFVVGDNNTAQRRNIRLGRSSAETAVIESGVNEGDKVITEGIQRVRPGAAVTPQPAGAAPRPG